MSKMKLIYAAHPSTKESAEILCSPFGTLFNFILETGKIPPMWKKGEIPLSTKRSLS